MIRCEDKETCVVDDEPSSRLRPGTSTSPLRIHENPRDDVLWLSEHSRSVEQSSIIISQGSHHHHHRDDDDRQQQRVFRALDVSPVCYIHSSRTTSIDLFTTTVTTRSMSDLTKVRSYQQPHTMTKMMTQFRLPKSRSHASNLPAVKVSTRKMHLRLVRERARFVTRLEQERDDRARLEHWAAKSIQALVKGHLTRRKTELRRGRSSSEDEILNQNKPQHPASCIQVFDLREDLRERWSLLDNDDDDDDDPDLDERHLPGHKSMLYIPEWRQVVTNRQKGKRQAKALQRAIGQAATLIQALVRRYIVRQGWHGQQVRAQHHLTLEAVMTLQCFARQRIASAVVQDRRHALCVSAVIRIQALGRGISGRALASRIAAAQEHQQDQTKAATKLQNVIRGRQAKKQVLIKKQKVAVKKIEGLAKGHLHRKAKKKTNKKKKTTTSPKERRTTLQSKETMAATTIQSHVRGRYARKRTTTNQSTIKR